MASSVTVTSTELLVATPARGTSSSLPRPNALPPTPKDARSQIQDAVLRPADAPSVQILSDRNPDERLKTASDGFCANYR